MKSDFRFFLKASAFPFPIDLKVYNSNCLYQTKHLIFRANDDNNIKIMENAAGVTITIGYPSLAFAEINWNEKAKKLSIVLDDLGLMNIFCRPGRGRVSISNSINILERSAEAGGIDERAFKFFLVSGFLPPNWTLRKNIKRVSNNSIWGLVEKTESHDYRKWPRVSSESVDESPSKIIEVLNTSVEVIKREVSPRQLRLSGGADTRMVSLLWNDKIESVCVHSPWLERGTDLDSNIATAWASEMGFSHKTLEPSMDDFAFFMNESERPFLTGLCGGEFLGGQFHRFIPSSPEDWIVRAEAIFGDQSCFRKIEDSEWVQGVRSDSKEWLTECVRVYLQSARSTIYHSLSGSWAIPYELYFRVVSPFVTPNFLNFFLRLSSEKLGDYELYQKVFQALGPRAQKIPICSYLTKLMPHLTPNLEWGTEPKSAKPTQKLTITEERITGYMNEILRQQGIDLNLPVLKRAFRYPKTRLNVLSLYFWMRPRFAERNIVAQDEYSP